MNALLHMALFDKRIDKECSKALPSHPNVARYIAGELRANDGSVLVARLLCQGLREIEGVVGVDWHRAKLFSVHGNTRALGAVCSELRAMDGKFSTRSGLFGWNMRGADEAWRENGRGVTKMRMRLAVNHSESVRKLYMTIFNCAYAMLAGVPDEVVTAAMAA